MCHRSFWRCILIFILCVTLAKPARAQTGGGKIVSNSTIAGAIAGVVAGLVVVVFVVYEVTKKKTVTGCVAASEHGLTVTDEADKQSYPLSGNTADVKAGERMKLRGHKVSKKEAGAKTIFWEVEKVDRDLGACQP